MSNNGEVIDVHCHLFNAQYLIMELVSAVWNMLWQDYPHPDDSQKVDIPIFNFLPHGHKQTISAFPGVIELAETIARFIHAALSDCDGNYKTAMDRFSESSLGEGSSLVVVPLMMDIYFALDDNEDEAKSIATHTPKQLVIHKHLNEHFHLHVNAIKEIVKEEMQKLLESKEQLPISDDLLDSIFNTAHEEMINLSDELKQMDDKYKEIELSPGYLKHMHDLEKLSEKYPDKVFPFLAVDPRRIGILKLIKMKVKVDGNNGIFKGIKLYPPLGYLPTHPNLRPIFAYCAEKKIPITLHCSEGGMQNYEDKNYVRSWVGNNNHWEDFKGLNIDKSYYYTHPEKWLPVLKEFPDLIINFAHFGGSEQFKNGDTSWMNSIIDMMNKYLNVYSDIAYFPEDGLAEQLQDIIDKNKILEERLMFGTDYVMMEDIGMKEYFDNFSRLDKKLLSDNARKFLGISG